MGGEFGIIECRSPRASPTSSTLSSPRRRFRASTLLPSASALAIDFPGAFLLQGILEPPERGALRRAGDRAGTPVPERSAPERGARRRRGRGSETRPPVSPVSCAPSSHARRPLLVSCAPPSPARRSLLRAVLSGAPSSPARPPLRRLRRAPQTHALYYSARSRAPRLELVVWRAADAFHGRKRRVVWLRKSALITLKQ